MTLAALVKGCRARGYTCSAVTDHSHGLRVTNGLTGRSAARQHRTIDAMNRKQPAFRLLKGVEANILADGRLDLEPDDLARFEMVLAAPHSQLRLTSDQTPRMLTADPHARRAHPRASARAAERHARRRRRGLGSHLRGSAPGWAWRSKSTAIRRARTSITRCSGVRSRPAACSHSTATRTTSRSWRTRTSRSRTRVWPASPPTASSTAGRSSYWRRGCGTGGDEHRSTPRCASTPFLAMLCIVCVRPASLTSSSPGSTRCSGKLVPLWRSIQSFNQDEQTIVDRAVDHARFRGARARCCRPTKSAFCSCCSCLRQPRARVVYVTSQTIAPEIVDYYLDLLPGVPASHARRRLFLVAPLDGSARPLSQKLLDRPDILDQIRSLVIDPDRAHLVPFNTTDLERDLALALGIPMYGADPRFLPFGTKSGARRIFAEVGAPHPLGVENLTGVEDLVDAIGRSARAEAGDRAGDGEAQRRRLRRRQRARDARRAAAGRRRRRAARRFAIGCRAMTLRARPA